MEMDFVEIAGKKCIQSTYHASKTDTCNDVNTKCLASNNLDDPEYNVNYSNISFEAQLNKNETFNLSINGTPAKTQMPEISQATKILF